MIARRREKQVLDALDDLSKRLRGLREERKAVITSHWRLVLFPARIRISHATARTDPEQPGVGPDGRLQRTIIDRMRSALTHRECERDRMNLAMLDNWQTFHEMIEDANRGNVSFYPVNALGLVALDKPINKDLLEGEAQLLVAEGKVHRRRHSAVPPARRSADREQPKREPADACRKHRRPGRCRTRTISTKA